MIHKNSDVQTNNIGADTKVWQNTIILSGAIIGNHCNINAHCFIENKVVIGNYVTIKCGNYIWDGMNIEDNVFIGPNVTFTNDDVPRSGNSNFKLKETKLLKGCSLGGGAILLPGVIIGEFALVGAGSLVTKNISAFELWYGSPALHKGYITREGKILSMNLICSETGNKYVLNQNLEPILQK
jgi:UDP-2-acetamido-3-amino-2,3-dideoxy-glucuronate N-acetyltransferase